MKGLRLIALLAVFGASVVLASSVKESAKSQAADVAEQALSGKSVKDIAKEKKSEAEGYIGDKKSEAKDYISEKKTKAKDSATKAKENAKEKAEQKVDKLLNKL